MSRRARQWSIPLAVGLLIVLAIGFLPATAPLEDDTSTAGTPSDSGASATPSGETRTTATHPIGTIASGITVTQEFPSAGTMIASVGLFLETYQRTNQGVIQVTIQADANGQWAPLAMHEIEKAQIKDNAFNFITFSPPLTVKKGQMVRIVLQADKSPADAISWWVNPTWDNEHYALFLNRDRQQGAAIFTASYGHASGYLFQILRPAWDRLTVFLSPFWQVALLLGLTCLVGSILLIGWLTAV